MFTGIQNDCTSKFLMIIMKRRSQFAGQAIKIDTYINKSRYFLMEKLSTRRHWNVRLRIRFCFFWDSHFCIEVWKIMFSKLSNHLSFCAGNLLEFDPRIKMHARPSHRISCPPKWTPRSRLPEENESSPLPSQKLESCENMSWQPWLQSFETTKEVMRKDFSVRERFNLFLWKAKSTLCFVWWKNQLCWQYVKHVEFETSTKFRVWSFEKNSKAWREKKTVPLCQHGPQVRSHR